MNNFFNPRIYTRIYNISCSFNIYFDQAANKDVEISTLLFAAGESIIIEQNGYYFDQTDITTNGYLGFKKIGDMLPYDYSPE